MLNSGSSLNLRRRHSRVERPKLGFEKISEDEAINLFDDSESSGALKQCHGEEDLGIMHLGQVLDGSGLSGEHGPSKAAPAISNNQNGQERAPKFKSNIKVSVHTAQQQQQQLQHRQQENAMPKIELGSPLSEQTGGEQESSESRSAKPMHSNNGSSNNDGDVCSLRVPPSKGLTADKFSKLNNLALLFDQGFILETEYKERRSQLIDELTGTKSILGETASTAGGTATTANANTAQRQARRRRRAKRVSSSIVVPRPPPSNFEVIPAERAVKHYFNLPTRSWHTEEVFVRIDDTPFARGGLRLVYHLEEVHADEYYSTVDPDDLMDDDDDDMYETQETTTVTTVDACTFAESTRQRDQADASAVGCVASDGVDNGGTNEEGGSCGSYTGGKARRNKRVSYVAKIAIDPNEDPSTYFRDVEMQAHCQHYAKMFNSYNPPRPVEFVKAWILELTERQGSPLCAVERFVSGDYRKHNNNYGYVSEEERNTPQAFSHFTYEVSSHTMLVVDIQGVGDMLTDPQIHTLNQSDFGKGNLGVRGFHKFLSTHKCNSICRYLKLNPVNPNYAMQGTIPNLPFMHATKIDKRRFKEGHYFEEEPALRKLVRSKVKERRRRVAGTNGASEEGDENDSFLRSYLWDSRDESGLYCSFCSCALL